MIQMETEKENEMREFSRLRRRRMGCHSGRRRCGHGLGDRVLHPRVPQPVLIDVVLICVGVRMLGE